MKAAHKGCPLLQVPNSNQRLHFLRLLPAAAVHEVVISQPCAGSMHSTSATASCLPRAAPAGRQGCRVSAAGSHQCPAPRWHQPRCAGHPPQTARTACQLQGYTGLDLCSKPVLGDHLMATSAPRHGGSAMCKSLRLCEAEASPGAGSAPCLQFWSQGKEGKLCHNPCGRPGCAADRSYLRQTAGSWQWPACSVGRSKKGANSALPLWPPRLRCRRPLSPPTVVRSRGCMLRCFCRMAVSTGACACTAPHCQQSCCSRSR